MATFPSIDPSFGITKSSSPLVPTTRFQDGYTQRIKFGLNVDPKSWAVTWENITDANAATIETFLEASVSDGDSFDWTPPEEGSAGKYVCDSWRKQINYAGRATITCTFSEVFEP